MKKLIIALLLVSVFIVILGCTHKTEQSSVEDGTVVAGNPELSADAISSDIESLEKEAAMINTSSAGDALVPISAEDLNTD